MGLGHQPELYVPGENSILGSEDFVDETIHRLGEIEGGRRRKADATPFDAESLLTAVELVFGISRDEFCGPGKKLRNVSAKQAFILSGRKAGATVTELSEILRIGTSNISRRFDDAKVRTANDSEFQAVCAKVRESYDARKAIKQT